MTRRTIITGLLILYACGWALASVRLLLAPVLTVGREVTWVVDFCADIAVFGWWAYRLRRTQ